MSVDWLLFLHLAGAFLYVAGGIAAAALRASAMRRERPSEIALLLRAVRPFVPVIGIGLLLVLVFGIWLADRLAIGLGTSWISATFALLGWVVVVGAVAGRQDRHTRELAERLAHEGDVQSSELSKRLRDPVNLGLNASLLIATVAIVALMVWKP
ncbi:MAG: DUF2269 domain-containing protein [Thermoleophilia bacterium]|nr:DUF2269 domain-containing protein [Thermoleophilia bacterium]MDH4340391.1 DUF2269 domain-containing protein [Thermoleophilia bacterium]MDH5279753.1 DUF2269 domain-containing protein [Thermoleophilia bacterium]